MAAKINIQTITSGVFRCRSPWVSIFFSMLISSFLMADGVSLAVNNLTAVGLSGSTSTSIIESIPLWGGAGALNLSSQSASFDREINLHHFDTIACGNCHEAPSVSGGLLFAEEKTVWNSVDINRSCTSSGCHEYDLRMNHPVGISVPPNVSVRMPLGPSSEITCLTCHETEGVTGLSDVDTSQERFLTLPDETNCQSCHAQFLGSLKQRSHWKFSQKAHLVPLTPDSVLDEDESALKVTNIDPESQSCLSCHDEISASVPSMNTRGYQMDTGYNMSDHPIGMNYQLMLNENSMYYHSLRNDDGRIRMFDGKVGCGSCHSLYSQTTYHLSVENNNSALCRECHNR